MMSDIEILHKKMQAMSNEKLIMASLSELLTAASTSPGISPGDKERDLVLSVVLMERVTG